MKSLVLKSPVAQGILAVVIISMAIVLLNRPEFEVRATENNPVSANFNASTINSGFANLVEAVSPAVVSVSVERSILINSSHSGRDFFKSMPPEIEKFLRDNFPGWGNFGSDHYSDKKSERRKRRLPEAGGSGVIINSEGYVITNFHVVEDADAVMITMHDGIEYQAEIVGTDEFADLAVLKIESSNMLPYTEFGDSDNVRVGDWVVAIGDPFGLSGSVTVGVLSGKSRSIAGVSPKVPLLQLDAAINKGNSGGPLFNTSGEVIGLNTLIISPTGTNVGVSFAVPSSVLSKVSEDLINHGRVSRGLLGVIVQGITPELADKFNLSDDSKDLQGVLVSDVTPDGAADRAGIEYGDIILEYDGQPIDKVTTLPPLVRKTDPGTEVEIMVLRAGERISLYARIGEMASSYEVAALTEESSNDRDTPTIGISIQNLTSDMRAELGIEDNVVGVMISNVNPESAAETAGLQPGDVIRTLDMNPTQTVDSFQQALTESLDSGSNSVLLHIDRNGTKHFAVVDLS